MFKLYQRFGRIMWKLIFYVIISVQICYCGFERTETGVRPLSLGYAYTGLSNDVWAINYNPAGLSQLVQHQIGLFYSPQPYGLSELSTISAAVAIPFNLCAVGFSFRKFGFQLYQEYSASVSIAKEISRLNFGINLNYYNLRIQNYGSAGTFGVDLGVLVKIDTEFSGGIFLRNANSPTIGKAREKLPQTFTVGFSYSPLQKCSILFDLQKETSYEVSPRFGFEYWLIEVIAVRGGWMNIPAKYTAGIGLKFMQITFDYGFDSQQDLGWTHCISLMISW